MRTIALASAALAACVVASSPARAQQTPPTSAAPSATPRVAVFDVHLGQGIDARVGPLAMAQLRRTAAALGYTLVDEGTSRGAAARAGAAGALTPERAVDLVRSSGGQHGVFASVTASGGKYVATVQATHANGAPARSANAPATAAELDGVLDRLLRETLGLPATPAAPAPLVTPAPAPASSAPAPAPAAPAPEAWPAASWRGAIFTEGAVGVSGGSFYNHLVGARIDRRFTPEVALGLSVAYANLKGKEGRAHNVLPWVMLEYRLYLSSDWAIPLRVAPGYLPKNGPVFRTSAGVAVALSESLDIGADLLAPTIWIVNERAVVSLDFALELATTF